MKTMAAFGALLALGCTAPSPVASAQNIASVGAFDSIELRGGGDVTVRHGRVHRVTLVRGDLEVTGVEVRRRSGNAGATLVIDACRTTCGRYDLRIEIETPDLEAAAVTGGGTIRLDGLPARSNLALAVTGGGDIDARSLSAANVAAAIRGGGTIETRAEASLAASVTGGGTVRHSGPAQVATAIHGGGEVVRVD